MNLQELRTFTAIVECGSLVRASALLNVTQSTVTARLKSLEDEVGQTLLYRNRSGATLTAAGIRLLRYADTITHLWRQARAEISLPRGVAGLCNFACEYDLWPHLGQRYFEALRALEPGLAISVWLGSQNDVAQWLDAGKSDLALSYRRAISDRQGQIAFPADDLILVSTARDTPAKGDPTYVYVEAGDAFGRDHAAAYADAGTARMSFGNAQTGLDYILTHEGSAYLPRRMASPHLASGALFPVPEAPTFTRAVFLSYNSAARDGWGWFDTLTADFTPGGKL